MFPLSAIPGKSPPGRNRDWNREPKPRKKAVPGKNRDKTGMSLRGVGERFIKGPAPRAFELDQSLPDSCVWSGVVRTRCAESTEGG